MRIELTDGQWVESKIVTWGDRRRVQAENPQLLTKDGSPVDPTKINEWTMDVVLSFIASWSFAEAVSKDSIERLLSATDGEKVLDEALVAFGFRDRKDDPKAP